MPEGNPRDIYWDDRNKQLYGCAPSGGWVHIELTDAERAAWELLIATMKAFLPYARP